jgi:hypothetical protein
MAPQAVQSAFCEQVLSGADLTISTEDLRVGW